PFMRVILGLLILLFSAGVVRAQSPTSKLNRIERFGQTYVSLLEWAKTSGFSTSWVRRDKELQVNTRAFKLRFTADSRQAEVNGLTVWLSVAITVRDGVPYVGLKDVETVLDPLLFPPAWKNTSGIQTVCIDPGHGGKDPGYIVGEHQEKN